MEYLGDFKNAVAEWNPKTQKDSQLIKKMSAIIEEDLWVWDETKDGTLNFPARRPYRSNSYKDRYKNEYTSLEDTNNNIISYVNAHWSFITEKRKEYSNLILEEGSDEFIDYLINKNLIFNFPTTLENYEELKDQIGVKDVIINYFEFLPTTEYIALDLDDLIPTLKGRLDQGELIDKSKIITIYTEFMLEFPETFSLESYDFLIKLLSSTPKVQDKRIFDLLLSIEDLPDLLAVHDYRNTFQILDYAVRQGLSSEDKLFTLLQGNDKKLSYLRGEVYLREGKPFREILLAFIKAKDFLNAPRIRKNLVTEQLGLGIGHDFECELDTSAETVLCLVEMLINAKN